MAERRAKFEKQFRHVWASGPTGVSMAHLSVSDRATAEELLSHFFIDTLVADAFETKQNGGEGSRTYLKNHKMVQDTMSNYRLTMVTSDDRVPELIEAVAAGLGVSNTTTDPPFDLLIEPMASGSKEYLDWVKEQTLKKDP
mmetsp:Transcript_1881/g.2603  ORF Transcript_1881/g.2603 Transcript_1881/m.2603 type:complete len:141 (+) Transcript_1881:2816-3238(+)